MFSLVAGRTTLGSGETDIPLQGHGVAAQHCYIENKAGSITLYPCGNQCSVDGLPITKPHRLTQGTVVDVKTFSGILFQIICMISATVSLSDCWSTNFVQSKISQQQFQWIARR